MSPIETVGDLDHAVWDACWRIAEVPAEVEEDVILKRLLALNGERAGRRVRTRRLTDMVVVAARVAEVGYPCIMGSFERRPWLLWTLLPAPRPGSIPL